MSVFAYWIAAAGRARKLRSLGADRSGVAALEFALVVPLLLAMYFVTIEVSQGIETNKRLARVASTIADLVTQQQETSAGQLEAVMQIGQAILKPYGRSDLKLVVTAIQVSDEDTPQARVAWSKASVGVTPPCAVDAVNSRPELPAKLVVRGTFLLRVQACLEYRPVITWAASRQNATGLGVLDSIFENGVLKMKESYFLRPRMSSAIPCPDC